MRVCVRAKVNCECCSQSPETVWAGALECRIVKGPFFAIYACRLRIHVFPFVVFRWCRMLTPHLTLADISSWCTDSENMALTFIVCTSKLALLLTVLVGKWSCEEKRTCSIKTFCPKFGLQRKHVFTDSNWCVQFALLRGWHLTAYWAACYRKLFKEDNYQSFRWTIAGSTVPILTFIY